MVSSLPEGSRSALRFLQVKIDVSSGALPLTRRNRCIFFFSVLLYFVKKVLRFDLCCNITATWGSPCWMFIAELGGDSPGDPKSSCNVLQLPTKAQRSVPEARKNLEVRRALIGINPSSPLFSFFLFLTLGHSHSGNYPLPCKEAKSCGKT